MSVAIRCRPVPSVALTALSTLIAVITVSPALAQEAPFLLGDTKEIARDRAKKAPASLSVSPRTIECELDAGAKATRAITVRNAGGQVLTWRVVSAPAWARVTPERGQLAFEERTTLQVALSPSSLPAGAHAGAITFEADDVEGSPSALRLRVVVREPPKPEPPPSAPLDQPDVPGDAPGPGEEPGEQPPAQPTDVIPRDTVTTAPASGFAVRAGYLVAATGGDDVTGGSPVLGGTYSPPRRSGPRWEFALEFAGERSTSHFTSWPLAARAAALFGSGRTYLLAGGAGLLEFVTDTTNDNTYTNGVISLDLGGGVRLGRGADVRMRYELLLGSDNLDGQAAVSVGYAF